MRHSLMETGSELNDDTWRAYFHVHETLSLSSSNSLAAEMR